MTIPFLGVEERCLHLSYSLVPYLSRLINFTFNLLLVWGGTYHAKVIRPLYPNLLWLVAWEQRSLLPFYWTDPPDSGKGKVLSPGLPRYMYLFIYPTGPDN